MKPLPALVAVGLAFALLLSPLAFSAGSITFSSPTAGSSFKGSASYTISGTVSPIPSQADSVFISVKNPSGTVVDAASVSVAAATGTFTYSTAVGGSSAWTSGTYTITATDSYGATGTITFAYTGVTPVSSAAISVQAVAASPDLPGQTVQVTALVSFSNGTLATSTTWAGSHYHDPSGAATALSSPTNIGPGMYMWTIALPSTAANGLYSVHLKANVSGIIAWGVAGFTVNTALAPNTSVIQNDLKGNFSSLNQAMTSLTSTINTINTNVGTLMTDMSSLTTTVGNINTAVTNIQQSLPSAGSISTTQTYVLVVAVLAAITLVLELAILVRKLS